MQKTQRREFEAIKRVGRGIRTLTRISQTYSWFFRVIGIEWDKGLRILLKNWGPKALDLWLIGLTLRLASRQSWLWEQVQWIGQNQHQAFKC